MPKRYLTVEVTEEDIKNGDRWRAQSCPLALALYRQYPRDNNGARWLVGILDVLAWDREAFNRGQSSSRLVLSKAATRFIKRFDNGKPVKPATFRLALPEGFDNHV